MAAFNWFERSYEEPTKDPKDAETSTEETDKAETPVSSEDYLNWAKAAYQNIQARQEDESPESDGDTESTPDETADPETADPEKTEIEATEASPSEEEPSAEAETTESADPETAEPTAVIEDSETALPAQAFWAKAQQAQAEREERLERLESEAILEPEPEPEPAPPEQTFVPLDIDLDEAFLWSAEVLAAQGRRPDEISLEEITWLNKLRQGLDKTRRGLVNNLKAIVGQGPLNDEAVEEIEALLLQADVGVAATDKIITALQDKLREETLPPEQAIAYLKKLLRDMLEAPLDGGHNLTFTPEKEKLSIWLMTGVNGAGKTTTIGKLAHIATKSEFKCLIGAADTFRAAAVEQVKVWGARSGVDVIANPGQNTDPAAVVYDAISAANSRDTELLLIDTAGRLQNKKNLMDELSKVRKIIDKKAPDANVESLLVLDATLGQNGLRQAQVFAEAAQLSGVVLTKLDGTARGGVALAVVEQLGLPIRFIGAGEGIEDLRPFSSYEFIEALLSG
ncbi:MAG: signal recognition particle-docking protein FtsY [Cyanobacteria bacterium J06627_28]